MHSIVRGAAALALAAATASAAGVAETPSLTAAGAREVAAAAAAEARRLGAPGGAIAVVDAGGHLVHLERLDGTFPAAALIAYGKAHTAALFRRPTQVFEDAIVAKGRTSMLALPDFTPLEGGVPVEVAGQVVGAVGVSGAASAAQDTEIALAGAAAFETAAEAVVIEGARTEAAFVKGAPLVETGEWKVHASRRDAAGDAEVHETDTDIFYVLSGRATFVTGGRLVEPRTVAPGELRAKTIDGGATRELGPGDLVVVPRGMPHWFRAVPGPFTYYVVKVTR